MTPRWSSIVVAFCLASPCLRLSAQFPQPGYTQQTPDPRPHSPEPDVVGDRMRASQVRTREIERQDKMVSETNRMVLLCKQLENNLKAHGQPNADDLRSLQEIEKLARSVKDRMRQ